MIRKYIRKTSPYDPADMKKAVAMVLDPSTTTGYKAAAKLYGLKWQTVRDHVKKPESKLSAGRRTVLSATEEEEFSTCLKLLPIWGFEMTKETQEVVGEYLQAIDRKSPFIDGVPGPDWQRNYHCARADGVMLPPYILYAAKNFCVKWTENGPDGARYNVSDKGWMDTACFNDWFQNHFVTSLSQERPVILIFDGHASPLSIQTVQLALKEQVIIFKLPSNSTHLLQPLDVGVYGHVKTA
ncbi:hypothetical protein RRG08_006799 [Elysia crispata]|uniref:DDE-1 domain-containing protein n=1 Tax=Elysia crispata TaxID=231223 RepID=A0AAE1E6I9_9GAST|nr:hypothetical protein RRG08_006799 [Elysia crispata]